MGRDNRNEMGKLHRKKERTLQAKLKQIREKLGITISPKQWSKISFPAREQMLRQVYPERYIKPQPPPSGQPHQPAPPATEPKP